MSSRKQGQTQEQASAKAGLSERSARRIEDGRISVLEHKERHGTEASVRHRARKVEQIESRGIGCGRSGQSVPAGAQQVLDRGADSFHLRGKLYRDYFREQVRLRLGRRGNQAGIASYLYVPGKQIARAK